MRKRWLMQTRLSGASRWSASEIILGGGIFKRYYGEFSTGVDKWPPRAPNASPAAARLPTGGCCVAPRLASVAALVVVFATTLKTPHQQGKASVTPRSLTQQRVA